MIAKTLSEQIKEALKKGDSVRVSTLRLLSGALHNEEIAKQKELSEEEEIAIVRRELKKREEAVEAYEKGGRLESSEKEKKEAEILKEFLPAQMSEEELAAIVERVIGEIGASSPQDFGKVMGAVVARVKGQAEGKTVAQIVQQKLNQTGP